MKNINRRQLFLVLSLILATGVIMGITVCPNPAGTATAITGVDSVSIPGGSITMRADLVQDKVLRGSDGLVTLALTLEASQADRSGDGTAPVDLVVVLDRSGSMNGRKIQDARRAVLELLDHLSMEDRLGIVAYSNVPETLSALRPLTVAHRRELRAVVPSLRPAGGTNLGGGLEAGLALFAGLPMDDHRRKLLLISDGLANQGLTDPDTLGRMAASGLSRDWVISTVGVGNDFNEHLMTTLADHGGGTYTYMDNPAAFAAVFQREYRQTAATAATGMTVSIPLQQALELIDAGGYPIEKRSDRAVFNPGSVRFGQARTLYLTFKIPTEAAGDVAIEGLQLVFRSSERRFATRLTTVFRIACVENPDDVLASIRKDSWTAQVLQEDFGRLKAAVADALRAGDEEQALEHIEVYRKEKEAINRVVASPRVSQNLGKEVTALKDKVRETFAGPPQTVLPKQKKNAKTLQYEAYRERRDNT